MRLMSVAFTEDAVRARRKTVTRRNGWLFAQPGDQIALCRKVMGRKKGEPLDIITTVEIIDVRREPLNAMLDDLDYGFTETTLEGFPEGHPEHFPSHFVEKFFLNAQRMKPTDHVTRIQWRYLDETPAHGTP